jgi:pimeloyl-ACP methyl ester carboxylesterase
MEQLGIIQKDPIILAGDERLAARFVFADDSIQPQLLFLHGAGKATKERGQPLAQYLAEKKNISSLLFDFSGHGESTGTLAESSLEKRLFEASTVIERGKFIEPISVCGFSMGGYIALELLKEREIRSIILFYSAIYSSEVFSIPFGNPNFTSKIREKNSWESSDIFETIKTFPGNLLIVTGEKDDVVPPEIPRRLFHAASKARRKKLIVIPNAPHLFLPIIFESALLLEEISATIEDYVLLPD